MNEILVNVIAGLIVNAVSSTAAFIRNGLGRQEDGDERQRRNTLLNGTRTLVVPAIGRLQKQIESTDLNKVTDFLRSPEAEILFRHYLMTVWADKVVEQEEYLKEQIAAYLYLTQQLQPRSRETTGSTLHTLFLDLAQSTTSSIDNRIGYHFRESVWAPQGTSDLRTLPRTAEFLKQLNPDQVASIVRFESLYLAQASERHRYIIPPSWDSKEPVPIDHIYVAPKLTDVDSAPTEQGEHPNEIHITELIGTTYRAVVLGNPGAGKSTLTEKLMYDLSLDRLRHNYSAPSIPFRVVLKDYASNKVGHNVSLLEYITVRIKTDYMVDIPELFVEYFLETGRGIVLFDGLDELVESYQRQDIAADVRAFSARYGSVPIIVTSRAVGYEVAPLPYSEYAHYYLQDFSDSQVREYSQKWFSVSRAIPVPEKAQFAEAFVRESASVQDLRSNPLMLALLCNIYRGERHIPRNRADVYRKCSVMLFERWDKDRGIVVSLPFVAHVRYAIAHLAEWIYSNQRLQSGVGERELVNKTKSYLSGRVFDTQEEAESAAEQFIGFCRGRAWVFTDVGEELYQFSHRTFLEYFAALNVSRRVAGATALWEILKPRLARGEWEMVAQLALAMFDEFHEGGAEEVLSLLLEDAKVSSADAPRFIDWTLRSLAAVVPAPNIRRRVAELALERTIRSTPHDLSQTRKIDWTSLSLFSYVASDNIASMADAVVSALRVNILSEDPDAAAGSAVLFLLAPLISALNGQVDWRPYLSDYKTAVDLRLHRLASTNPVVAALAYRRGLISFDELIRWHNLKAIFIGFEVQITNSIAMSVSALLEDFVSSIVGGPSSGNFEFQASVIVDEILHGTRVALEGLGSFTPTTFGRPADLALADSAFDSLDMADRTCVWLLFAARGEQADARTHQRSARTPGQLNSVLKAKGTVRPDVATRISFSAFGRKYGRVVEKWINGQLRFFG
jgi:hypothetical protein